MKLSIRNKILLPLLATLALGMGCAGLIGYKASVGQADVGSVVQKAFAAKSLATEMQGRLSDAAVVVGRVTAMTNFVSPKEVASSFEPINRDIETDLEKLSALSLSSAIGQKLDVVRAAHKAWRLDAAILLGLTASNQVPTEEKIARSLRVLTGELQSLNARVDQDATAAIANANRTFTDEISQIIGGAGIVSVLVFIGLFALARSISMPVLRLSQGMQDLAEGSTQKPIPYLGRKDEMGQMAASVEVFRQNAIERAKLEANAQQLRAQTEQQRLDDQRIAEERAQERLRVATSGLASGLQRLAAGDLSVRLSESFTAEFEALRHDFNQSVQQLGEAMASVMSSAHSIDSGTIAIRGSTEELANRTEQQAASLEETVAALNEVTAHVAQSTRMAEDASHLADQANQAANGSIQVVMRAVSAMGQIEASSSQINSIISVIDQIAFQTNLLALNAGVEAARAGEAGKGFAVVAQEVRELAQRSASAAQEIKQLIARSGNEVKSGVELVNQTGESLKTIGESITSMNQFMSTIVQTARDQSTSLQQVNTAMQQMDRVTQQNSQKVGETESSTRVLAAETERLRDLVQQFRMGEQRSSRAMPLARAS